MRKRLIWAALLSTVVLAASAVASVEKDGFKVAGGATEGGSVACKQGQAPTGGGFELDQKLSGPLGPERLMIQTTYPDGKRWKVEAYNFDGSEKRGSAIVICEKNNGLVVKSKAVEVPVADDESQATAKCPAGSKVIGGGGLGPGSNEFLRGSFPAGNGWGARYENTFGGRIEAFAVCDKSPGRIEITDGSTVSDPTRRGGRATVTAKAECPGKAEPVGGGHYSTDGGTSYRESRPVDGAWKVTADADEGVTVSAYAVCQK